MEEQISQASSRGRGRPKVKEEWTRVISLNDDEAQAINRYELAADLMMVSNFPQVPAQRLDGPWEPLFFSKDYIKFVPQEELNDCKLNEKTLLKLGKEVSKHRTEFELLAERLSKKEDNYINSSSAQNKRQSFYDVQKLSQ